MTIISRSAANICCCCRHPVHNDPGLCPRVRPRLLTPRCRVMAASPTSCSEVWLAVIPGGSDPVRRVRYRPRASRGQVWASLGTASTTSSIRTGMKAASGLVGTTPSWLMRRGCLTPSSAKRTGKKATPALWGPRLSGCCVLATVR